MSEIVNCDTCGARKEVTIGVKHGEGLYFKAVVELLPQRTTEEGIRWAWIRFLKWNAEGRQPYPQKQSIFDQLNNYFHYDSETNLWSFQIERFDSSTVSGKFKVHTDLRIEIMGMLDYAN